MESVQIIVSKQETNITIENLSKIMKAVKKMENKTKKTSRLPKVTNVAYEMEVDGKTSPKKSRRWITSA